jgi:hypothetical protein
MLHNPSFPSVNEICASTLQQVLVPDLLALGVPISSCDVLRIFQHRSSLLDCLEWQIPEHVVNKGIEARSDERYVLGSLAILLQSDIKTHEYDKYAEYAYMENMLIFLTYMGTLQSMSLST